MLGLWQVAAGDMVQAREQFEAARRAEPAFTAADIALADLDRRQNQAAAGQTRLRNVISREPSNTGALLLLAEIERLSGNHVDAIAHYRAVLAIDSSNLVALNNIGIQLTPSSPDEALGFAQRALEIAPENPAVQDTLGWIYYRKGIYRSAVQYLKAAVANEPNPQRQVHLALSYIKSGEARIGQEMLRTAIRQDPSLSGLAQQ
jgi:Tfp pilus assembly protein PilF